MGACCSKNKEEFTKSETPVYPLPIISPTDAHTTTIFDPEFNPTQKSRGKPESVPLLDEQTTIKPPEPKKEEALSDSSSSIDQNMISKLLAEVDTSDLSN
ncbi:hypothetical protein M9Y10_040705 [Tritrichomonas musculus]|uniref:Uncharacterized protein n=1 Tax=Tritrichomonas musculus TaxID=1915356 RepID=A0ABR2K5B7_9EUKA